MPKKKTRRPYYWPESQSDPLKSARDEAARELSMLPSSVLGFRQHCTSQSDLLLTMLQNLANGRGGGGYYMDDETRDEIAAAVADVKEAFRSGAVRLNVKFRDERIDEIVKPAMLADRKFPDFLRVITSGECDAGE
jgi:hypothetical protein